MTAVAIVLLALLVAKVSLSIKNLKKFTVRVEGVFERGMHVHFEYTTSPASPYARAAGRRRKVICYTALVFKGGTTAFVRGMHSAPYEQGTNLRVLVNGFGEMRTEKIKDPEG